VDFNTTPFSNRKLFGTKIRKIGGLFQPVPLYPMYSPPWFLSLLRKERETTSHSAYFAPSLILREGDWGVSTFGFMEEVWWTG
jgi:hypothetical protein